MIKYIAAAPFGWDSGYFWAADDEAAMWAATEKFTQDIGGEALPAWTVEPDMHSIPSRGEVPADVRVIFTYGAL